VIGGLAALALSRAAHAQGFAGLGSEASGFAEVIRGRALAFPADHGPHPDYRIEWWYLTANLNDAAGQPLGIQWTLFRQAMAPVDEAGWSSRQIWMAHAAVTTAATHRSTERFARGGIGQAGVVASPFAAHLDNWQMRGTDAIDPATLSPLAVSAVGADFSYALTLTAQRPLVLQGDAGYSKKSDRGQASYYYSQPYFDAQGSVTLDGKAVMVTGQAWMDREWSSQPLASDQTGWDWLSLHLDSGDKVMLFRLRQSDGSHYFAGNWIGTDGRSVPLPADGIELTPTVNTTIGARNLPTSWRVAIPSRSLLIDTSPLNQNCWMATRFPYWEGPISLAGSHAGQGYLEMTGY
jgi:predicted secreted hydrolase